MNKGFTLIELLIVIAIVSILFAIVVTALKGDRDRDTTSLKEQCERYEDDRIGEMPSKCIEVFMPF